jgi:molybdopterin-containing oxidoreductase family membrane subunit
MIEKALSGSKKYWIWVLILAGMVGIAFLTYLYQYFKGLTVTGMSRDVPWGLYIAQFTFLVGVAASAVMVVIPYYLHDFKVFGKLAVLGEFVAVAAVSMCVCFIIVDMGQPTRVMNMFLHPTPNSLMFWDTIVCFGYLILNVIITFVTFGAERKHVPPPKWIKPVIYLSIPWAISIHTVTAFLYAGLSARPFWMTAILAPRFLASAFSAGPALLILLCLILRRFANYDVGETAIRKLAVIVTYAMVANIFFVALELFTAVYSNIPAHLEHFRYMFFGLERPDGTMANTLVPWMWISMLFSVTAALMLLTPSIRNNLRLLGLACVLVFFGLWIEKGLGLVITGFIPNPMESITEYVPSGVEIMIALGIWSLGFLIITVLYKVAISVRKADPGEPAH